MSTTTGTPSVDSSPTDVDSVNPWIAKFDGWILIVSAMSLAGDATARA